MVITDSVGKSHNAYLVVCYIEEQKSIQFCSK